MAVAGLGVFFSGPGQTYSVSVFINSYITEFGWSRAYVSSLYSMGTLLAGLLLTLMGRLIDRFGHRLTTSVIVAAFGLVCFYMTMVFHPIMLLVGFFLVRLLGQGSMTLTSSTLVAQWFVSKRGRAMSFMALGGTISSAILPPLNTWIIQTWGWRLGWHVWALLLFAVMLPAAWFLIRNKPEDIGLVPDGGTSASPDAPEATPEESWTVKEAMGTRAFWLMLFVVTIPAAINTGITFHLASIMEGAGFPADAAAMTGAAILSTLAMVQLPFNFVAGYLSDRYRPNLLVALSFVGHFISLIILLVTRTYPMAMAFGVIWGIISAFWAITFGIIWPSYYGRTHLGSIRGMAMTAMVIGSAFGPLPFGFAFDYFGGYREILLVSMIFPVLGALAALLANKPHRTA